MKLGIDPISHAVIRVDDDAGNVIETHSHTGEFKEWSAALLGVGRL
jgi:hypothetical protein